jgi:hypothetical protein
MHAIVASDVDERSSTTWSSASSGRSSSGKPTTVAVAAGMSASPSAGDATNVAA